VATSHKLGLSASNPKEQNILSASNPEEQDMATVMGMNLSNKYMSTPISLVNAATMLKTIGIDFVKLFEWDNEVKDLNFRRYVKQVALGIPNDKLPDLADSTKATALVDKMITDCGGSDLFQSLVRWVCVGNEPLGSWFGDKYVSYLAPAVINVHNALHDRKLEKIGVTVPQNFEFMDSSPAHVWPPSQGMIQEKYKQTIAATCAVMEKSGAPFMVNIYPYLTRRDNPVNVPLDYALFTKRTPQFTDQGKAYYNLFDAMIDTLHFGLKGINCADLPIVVGECGWPTDGGADANMDKAKTFLQNLIDHCNSDTGTPQRPGKIPCFAFEMYDEDKKDTSHGLFEHYWGICYSTGSTKFPLKW